MINLWFYFSEGSQVLPVVKSRVCVRMKLEVWWAVFFLDIFEFYSKNINPDGMCNKKLFFFVQSKKY